MRKAWLLGTTLFLATILLTTSANSVWAQKPAAPAKNAAAPSAKTATKNPHFKIWETLAKLDMKTGKATAQVDALENKSIKVPGYMIPLEVNDQKTAEFLVVPTLPSCIHVPPPPPNQTILVKMKDKKRIPLAWEPVWMEGKLKIVREKKDRFGEASFEMEGLKMQPVKESEYKEFFDATMSQFDCFGRDRNEPVCQQVLGALPNGGGKGE